VHTTEFGFEHDLANVSRAVRDMRIDGGQRLTP